MHFFICVSIMRGEKFCFQWKWDAPPPLLSINRQLWWNFDSHSWSYHSLPNRTRFAQSSCNLYKEIDLRHVSWSWPIELDPAGPSYSWWMIFNKHIVVMCLEVLTHQRYEIISYSPWILAHCWSNRGPSTNLFGIRGLRRGSDRKPTLRGRLAISCVPFFPFHF